MRCSVAMRAAAASSMETAVDPSLYGPTLTSGRPVSCRRSSSRALGWMSTGDDAVESSPGKHALEQPISHLRTFGHAVECEVVVERQQRFLDARQQFGEEPAVHGRHHDADGLRATGGQARRGGVRDIRQLARRIRDAGTGVLRDITAPAQRTAPVAFDTPARAATSAIVLIGPPRPDHAVAWVAARSPRRVTA